MSRKELSQRCDHSSGFQAQYCIYFKGRFTEVQFIYSLLSPVQLFVALWTVARQAPLSMGFPRQEYWSGLPFPPPGDLPDPGIQPASLASPALAGGLFTTSTNWEAPGRLGPSDFLQS